MIRADGRSCGESRPVEITTGFIKFAEEIGRAHV